MSSEYAQDARKVLNRHIQYRVKIAHQKWAKMGKVPKIRPTIANDPMRNKHFPVFPSMICVF